MTRTETGLRFTKYVVEVETEVSDVDRAREALEQTKAHCLIANALVAPVEIEATIHLPARKAS